MTTPSELLRQELKSMLEVPGALNAFCDANGFKFNSLYKIATKSIEQPGLDYGLKLLTAIHGAKKIELPEDEKVRVLRELISKEELNG